MDRGQRMLGQAQEFTGRLFNRSEGMLDGTGMQQLLRTSVNFVQEKVSVSRETQRNGMLGGFLLSAIFLLFAVFSLPYIIFSPTSFTSYFSLSMLTLLFSLFLRRNLQSDGQNDGLSRLIPNSMVSGRD